jgi:hypothetical protein
MHALLSDLTANPWSPRPQDMAHGPDHLNLDSSQRPHKLYFPSMQRPTSARPRHLRAHQWHRHESFVDLIIRSNLKQSVDRMAQ